MKILACIMMLLPCLAFGSDTVLCMPEKPTTADTIKFRLFTEDYCCCAQFSSTGAGVSDSAIYLSYTAFILPCKTCICLLPGAWIEFYSTPLKAGTYTIYEMKPYYCPPGQICLAVMPPPLKVGKVTVTSAPTKTIREKTCLPSPGFSTIHRRGSMFQVDFSNPSGSWITISAYMLNGQKLFQLSTTSGTHLINLKNASPANGIIVFRVEGEGFSVSRRINLMESR
jgi:hypothetical protein